jgi:hypothetical protein
MLYLLYIKVSVMFYRRRKLKPRTTISPQLRPSTSDHSCPPQRTVKRRRKVLASIPSLRTKYVQLTSVSRFRRSISLLSFQSQATVKNSDSKSAPVKELPTSSSTKSRQTPTSSNTAPSVVGEQLCVDRAYSNLSSSNSHIRRKKNEMRFAESIWLVFVPGVTNVIVITPHERPCGI